MTKKSAKKKVLDAVGIKAVRVPPYSIIHMFHRDRWTYLERLDGPQKNEKTRALLRKNPRGKDGRRSSIGMARRVLQLWSFD